MFGAKMSNENLRRPPGNYSATNEKFRGKKRKHEVSEFIYHRIKPAEVSHNKLHFRKDDVAIKRRAEYFREGLNTDAVETDMTALEKPPINDDL